jgi:hypothetical protein
MTDTPVSKIDYDAAHTALLFVDPYNDFLSEGGKLWPSVAEVAHSVGLHDNLRNPHCRPARGCRRFHRAASPR